MSLIKNTGVYAFGDEKAILHELRVSLSHIESALRTAANVITRERLNIPYIPPFVAEPEKPKEPPARGVEEILSDIADINTSYRKMRNLIPEALRLYREERAAAVGERDRVEHERDALRAREEQREWERDKFREERDALKARIEKAYRVLPLCCAESCRHLECHVIRILRGEP